MSETQEALQFHLFQNVLLCIELDCKVFTFQDVKLCVFNYFLYITYNHVTYHSNMLLDSQVSYDLTVTSEPKIKWTSFVGIFVFLSLQVNKDWKIWHFLRKMHVYFNLSVKQIKAPLLSIQINNLVFGEIVIYIGILLCKKGPSDLMSYFLYILFVICLY